VARADRAGYWRRTRLTAVAALSVAVLALVVVDRIAGPLNARTLEGFPLGYGVAALALPLLLAALIFRFAEQQDDIDRQHGTAEDD